MIPNRREDWERKVDWREEKPSGSVQLDGRRKFDSPDSGTRVAQQLLLVFFLLLTTRVPCAMQRTIFISCSHSRRISEDRSTAD